MDETPLSRRSSTAPPDCGAVAGDLTAEKPRARKERAPRSSRAAGAALARPEHRTAIARILREDSLSPQRGGSFQLVCESVRYPPFFHRPPTGFLPILIRSWLKQPGGERLGRKVGSHSCLLILTIPLTLSHFFKENLSCPLFIATPSFQDQKL